MKNTRKAVLNKRNGVKKTTKKTYNGTRRKSNNKKEKLVLLKYENKSFFSKIKIFFINRIRVIKFDMKKFKNKFKYGTLKDRLLIILMLFLIMAFSIVIAFTVYVIISAPEMSETALYKNNSTVLYDIDGNEFARLGTENREKITYDEIPEVLIDAIVATEDSRFFQHNGIDIARFSKAVVGQLMGRADAGGGSTLTMQVSKVATGNTTSTGIKGIIRKFTDIYTAVFVLEKKYTKEQILTFYVNLPNLGASSYGVEQACQSYFGKSVSELNLSEAALIAGLFQSPNAYYPFTYPEKAEARRNTVLNLMYRHGYITASERDAAKAIPVKSLLKEHTSSAKNVYQGYIDTVVSEVIKRTKTKTNPKGDNPYETPMKIYTNLDRKRQDTVNEIYEATKVKNFKWKDDYDQAGIAVMDVKTGALVAVGAGRNKTTSSSWNFATQERRHPGSTAKPVLDYGPAIEYLGWGSGNAVIDEQYKYSNGASIKNYNNIYLGVMTAKTALAQSRNIPALLTFQQTSNEQKLEFSKGLGWKVEDDGNGNILETCSIGGFNGVTPVEMSAAYATFARGGTYIEPHSFTSLEYTETGDTYTVKPEKREVMSESTAYIINMILKYAVTSGSVGAGGVSGTDIAAKTGTSTVDASAKKYYGWKGVPIGDSWEVAYSPDYAIATWYGYKERNKDYYLVSAVGGKARKSITKHLTSRIMKKNSKFKKPSSVVTATIEKETDPVELASEYTPDDLKSTEYYKKGTQPTSVSERFSKLKDPSNLTYRLGDTTITLNWNATPTPNAINREYLQNYFSSSKIYSFWSDKFLKKRIDYNNNVFGSFGYRIYANFENGASTDLGFTTTTSFTTALSPGIKSFTVKSSYQKFKANASDGITVAVDYAAQPVTPPATENSTTTSTVKYDSSNLFIKAKMNPISASQFNNLGNDTKDKILDITYNGVSVYDEAVCSEPLCLDENENDLGDCRAGIPEKTRYVVLSCSYMDAKKSLTINIK